MTLERNIPIIVGCILLGLVMRSNLHTAIKVLLAIIIFISTILFGLSLMK